jgi:hypothetical protein
VSVHGWSTAGGHASVRLDFAIGGEAAQHIHHPGARSALPRA